MAPTDGYFEQFCVDVTEALHAGTQEHIAGSLSDAHKKTSKEVQEEFLTCYRARIAAIKKLRDAYAVRWPPSYREFQAFVDPTEHLRELEALAEAMRFEADEWKSTGRDGRPPMRAFNALAKGLVFAYRRSTEMTGVGHGAREGKLRAFVEKVLPVAGEIAKAVTGRMLKTPATPDAIGEYLNRVASAD